ncbi:spermidine synthase [Lysobacter koreensis]|uniref:Spermidine synthase n=1 Tax=Lysobacter koreensis TaxID=266122 RepID=A0ABW2YKF8_9GAMM
MPESRMLPFAIGLLSAAALAYQLLLMRWLAIAHWHPFAVMIISLALLGHGASGTWLSLWLRGAAGERLQRRFERGFPWCAAGFALSAVLALWLAQTIPFNGLELAWNPRQLLWLSALYLVLALPFFFAASCFGLAFARHGAHIPALYGADLLGAGIGALAAVALLWLPVDRGLVLAAACGPIAAALLVRRWASQLGLVLVAFSVLALWPARVLAPTPNEFKGLSKALLMPGARILAQRHGPYGWVAVLDSPRIPLRYAPGLSLDNHDELPAQLGVFTDGDGLAPITRRGDGAQAYLGRMLSALPYRVQASTKTGPRVLVLGAGGGQEVLQALALGARAVDAVEPNPQRLRLVRDDYAAFAGDLYRDPRVRVVHAEPRAFVRRATQRYDLIVLASGESFAGGGAGVQAAAEQYSLTVEAWRDYLSRLAPGGMLAATRWSKQPPRDELKLLATAIAALRAQGLADADARIIALRGWDASTWLVKRGRFETGEIAAAQAFAQAQGFDPVHVPGLRGVAGERFHQLDGAYLVEGARALLSPRAADYRRDYKFAIAPATDDRPYFGDFFRWRSLPELWRLREQGSAVLLDSGTLLLLATLLQALPLALLLVLLPLRALPRAPYDAASGLVRWRAGGYFLALGLAFMLVEIATLSRLALLVGHPWLAASVGLAGFLCFAGAGSLQAQRLLARADASAGNVDAELAAAVRRAVFAIALGLLWQLAVFAAVHEVGAGWPVPARALAGLLGIAPLAVAMGMPFPLGLARLARSAPAWVPWAWGLNGCASVIAAVAALLLAMLVGLRATLLCALALYAFAAWLWRARV